ncbi:MAG TPA: hypothetical protein VNJ12_09350 [Candidatus Dormibacteraeota bacterium]|nr:hypothetical protein [Candidatus Dormibacteraeota bacterium]
MSYLELAKRVMAQKAKERRPEPTYHPGNRPATCAASCYEVEPGKWIHHPWDGCTTLDTPEIVPVAAERTCWHCQGEKTCRCFCCAVRVAGGLSRWQPGTCHVCKGSGIVTAWVQ